MAPTTIPSLGSSSVRDRVSDGPLSRSPTRFDSAVTAYLAEPAGDLVAVQVDDSGEGIAPEIRQRAFTKFWTTGQRGGSGLGLYLVNGLVRANGGTVTIGESPAGGARIVTTWPTAGSQV